MDMTGKGIEISVQARLMQRLLGMKAAPGARKPSTIFAAMRDFGSVREFFTASTIGTIADLPFLVILMGIGALAMLLPQAWAQNASLNDTASLAAGNAGLGLLAAQHHLGDLGRVGQVAELGVLHLDAGVVGDGRIGDIGGRCRGGSDAQRKFSASR